MLEGSKGKRLESSKLRNSDKGPPELKLRSLRWGAAQLVPGARFRGRPRGLGPSLCRGATVCARLSEPVEDTGSARVGRMVNWIQLQRRFWQGQDATGTSHVSSPSCGVAGSFQHPLLAEPNKQSLAKPQCALHFPTPTSQRSKKKGVFVAEQLAHGILYHLHQAPRQSGENWGLESRDCNKY